MKQAIVFIKKNWNNNIETSYFRAFDNFRMGVISQTNINVAGSHCGEYCDQTFHNCGNFENFNPKF